MLENEPDTNQQPADGTTATPAATPPPRRRRAASRPAGPPATAADAPPIERVTAEPEVAPVPAEVSSQVEVTAPEQSQAEVSTALDTPQVEQAAPEAAADGGAPVTPTKRTAAKRPARKAAVKKAAAAVETTPVDGPAADQPEAAAEAPPKKRAPRKRAAKKVADPEAAVAESAQPSSTAADTPAAVDASIAPGEVVASPAGWEQPGDEAPQPVPSAEPTGSSEDVPAVHEAPEPDEVSTTAAALEIPASAEADTSADQDAVPAARDFGWLADPFAAPAPSPTNTAETNTVENDTAQADEDAENDEAVSDKDGSDTAEVDTAEDDTAAVDASEPDSASDDDDDSGEGGNRRRRRRRGGRRRRRSGGDSDSNDSDSSDEGDDADSDDESDSGQAAKAARTSSPSSEDADTSDGGSTDDSGKESEGDDSEGQGRRRRRRRRRGEETAALPDDPSDVVVRVREPRARKKASSSNEITGIEGSTRMEAKRQRRKDGRDAGRRRAPILSEAEFLARRESVNRQMIIRQREDLTQIAVLEDGILVEHYVDRESAASLIGNVYLGRVQNVLPSMEAAFIDIGRGRNAVLYAGEVDWDSFGAEGHGRKVEKVLKSGQMILVQVSKDPVGAKGARLTNHVSIPGRYIVYAPGGHLSGISRKLPDVERRRLKDILSDLVGESASVIVRTAAEGASEEELVRDVNRLKAQWEDIERKVKAGNSPQLLYGEPDLTVRIVRDLFTEDFSELVISGNGAMNDAYDAIMGYVTHVAPHLQERIRRWEQTGDVDLFSEYRLDEQIAKALERKVFLPSGGSLVIDRTEAMTVIDVNTGKFTGTGGNLEATVTSNNLEAAEEIVNQLRLRDIGGIIVIDFIDMVLPNNRELLLRRLVECLGRDRTRHQVAEVTSLGLVQMTRKKIGTGLLEAFGTECPTCHGRGYEIHDLPVDTQKQADGGAREQRPRDQRPKPGDTRGANGSRGGRGDSNRNDSNRSDGNRSEGNRNEGNRNDSRSSERGGNDRGGNAREYDRIESEAEEVSQLAVAEPSVAPEPTPVVPEPNSVVPESTPVVAEPTPVVDETPVVHETPDAVETPAAETIASPTADVESAAVEPSPSPEAGVPDEPISSPEAPVSSENGSSDDGSSDNGSNDNGSNDNGSNDNGSNGRAQYNDSLHDTPLEDEAPTGGGNGQSSRSRRGRRGGGRGGSSRRDQDNAPATESTPAT